MGAPHIATWSVGNTVTTSKLDFMLTETWLKQNNSATILIGKTGRGVSSSNSVNFVRRDETKYVHQRPFFP